MLLAALVVLWFVVLVPMVVTRGEVRPAPAGAADSGRTLQRRRTVDPLLHAETERVAIDEGALRADGARRVDVHAIRRRALGGLVALALLTLVGAVVVRSWLWAPQVLLDLLLVGYMLVLRKVARRERLAARRAARAAAREALWGPAGRPVPAAAPVPVPAAPASVPAPVGVAPQAPAGVRETVTRGASPILPHPSMPLAPVHPLRPGRVVAVRVLAPGGWQNSAVVGLDDDDIGFADIDVYQPRVVNA